MKKGCKFKDLSPHFLIFLLLLIFWGATWRRQINGWLIYPNSIVIKLAAGRMENTFLLPPS